MARRQINQTEAAAMLDTTPVFVSQLLSRTRTPGLTNAVHIERLTGIPVEAWLLSGDSESRELSGVGVKPARKTRR